MGRKRREGKTGRKARGELRGEIGELMGRGGENGRDGRMGKSALVNRG